MPGQVTDPPSGSTIGLEAVSEKFHVISNATPLGSAGEDDTCLPPGSQLRTAFGSKSAGVRAWPSQGGFYSLYPAEMDFLGLNRFSEAPRSDHPTEEDTLCQRMRAMGAQWFRHEDDVDKWTPPVIRGGKRIGKQQLWFGWPESGGVWVLERDELEVDRKGVGRIYNACTMEERCRVLQTLGATFFGKAADSPRTKDLDFPGRKDLIPDS
ncbi:MAG: hypothetical protein Q9184_004717 [Pyrenodesmia sp. 2 TL-2023]